MAPPQVVQQWEKQRNESVVQFLLPWQFVPIFAAARETVVVFARVKVMGPRAAPAVGSSLFAEESDSDFSSICQAIKKT